MKNPAGAIWLFHPQLTQILYSPFPITIKIVTLFSM